MIISYVDIRQKGDKLSHLEGVGYNPRDLFKGVVVVAIPKSELAYYRFSASLSQSLSEKIATAKRIHNKLSKLVSDQLSPFPLNVK